MFRKMIELLKKWFTEKDVLRVNQTVNETQTKTEVKKRRCSLLEDLEAYLFEKYDFRFNVLTEQPEYAPIGQKQYRLVDQRVLNTLCIDARDRKSVV